MSAWSPKCPERQPAAAVCQQIEKHPLPHNQTAEQLLPTDCEVPEHTLNMNSLFL